MPSRSFIYGLLLLAVSFPAFAGQDCTAMNATVPENGNNHQAFLTRENANAVKKCLEQQLAGGHKSSWEKRDAADALIIACPGRAGSPAMKAAEVETAVRKRQEAYTFLAAQQPANVPGGDLYSFLAERTGRSRQEADVLRGKYDKLGYFRSVAAPDGKQVSEARLISERHKKQLGIAGSGGGASGEKQQRAELKEKIREARKRGDTAEMMRLAQEGQQFANRESTETYEQSWRLMESQYPELLQASYPVRFTYMPEVCLD